MDKKLAVTVLMPVYNGEKYLRLAIESILKQTFTDFEFLIIDDGSSDGSVNIIKSYSDKRIKLVVHTKNRKLVATLNEGIKLARGEYIARMDCDDISTPERLEKQIECFRTNKKLILVGSDSFSIDENGKLLSYNATYISNETLRAALAIQNCFTHGSVMMRRDAVIKAGCYDTDIAEDYKLWIRLSKYGMIANIPRPLFYYRINPAGLNLAGGTKQQIVCRKIATNYWKSFGSEGPVTNENWSGVWPRDDYNAPPQFERRLVYSNLHAAFGYYNFVRGRYSKAVRHLLSGAKIQKLGLIGWFINMKQGKRNNC